MPRSIVDSDGATVGAAQLKRLAGLAVGIGEEHLSSLDRVFAAADSCLGERHDGELARIERPGLVEEIHQAELVRSALAAAIRPGAAVSVRHLKPFD